MKQGSRVIDKVTGKKGIIELLYAPGMAKCAVVRWEGQMEGSSQPATFGRKAKPAVMRVCAVGQGALMSSPRSKL